MREYDFYVFDLDGTLLDTLDDLANSVNYALASWGFATRTREEVCAFVGNGMVKLIERALPEGETEAFEQTFRTFRAHYAEHSADNTKPYDGIIAMLERLKKDGKKVAVVSNKADSAVKSLCEQYFAGLIDFAVGENEAGGVRKKPAPDSVLKVLKAFGEGSAVYIGDSDVDVETAVNSHLPCLSVTWGFRDRAFLKAHGATDFVDNPEEIY